MLIKKFLKLKSNEKGVTLLISILILALLTVFVSTALVNTTSSAVSSNNDAGTSQAFYAAYAGLEKMSKEFSDVFNTNTSASKGQLDNIKNSPPDIEGMAYQQNIRKLSEKEVKTIESGPYKGLSSIRETFFFTSKARTNTGVTVELTREFYNNLIPIFQFGIFASRHLEFFNGPFFGFGGRVHANGDIYLNPGGNGLSFRDKITVSGEVVRDVLRNGVARTKGPTNVFFPPAGQFRSIDGTASAGSVVNGPNVGGKRPGHPIGTSDNTDFSAYVASKLAGQVFYNVPPLRLPIENAGNEPIELIRRGIPGIDPANNLLEQSRFFNKAGIRITLDDTQAGLPGGTGGIQLDATSDTPTSAKYADERLGFVPKLLKVNGQDYQASRINGHRVKGWIKVEAVTQLTNGGISTRDITREVLSLGTARYDLGTTDFNDLRNSYGTAGSKLNDTLAIVRLQRYSLPGNPIKRSDNADTLSNSTALNDVNKNRLRPILTNATTGLGIVDDETVNTNPALQDTPSIVLADKNTKLSDNQMLAYPIVMFDTREALTIDSNGGKVVGQVESRGVMSIVDIDTFNLARLLTGDFDDELLTGGFNLQAKDIFSESNGWIVYMSDRRGDSFTPSVTVDVLRNKHFGKYDMETTYGDANGANYIPQPGQTLFEMEDTNGNNAIEAPSGSNLEGAVTNERLDIIDAATKGSLHPNTTNSASALVRVNLNNNPKSLFRRALRLSNGSNLLLPGVGSLALSGGVPAPAAGLNINRGLTIVTENPAYILGNYNTTGATLVNPITPPENYQGNQVPAALISDSVSLLSNAWQDANTFLSPYAQGGRAATNTFYRVAVLTGRVRDGLFMNSNDTIKWGVRGSSGTVSGSTEPDDTRLYGGVHNFLRYLENWGDDRLFYVGSIIDGWDSWQANGSFKCCNTVYSPPTRDYTFNTSFLDPNRLPPGTPNLQYVLFTGFRENVRSAQE
jgi:hypothetical protein